MGWLAFFHRPTGIHRKLVRVFLLQMLFISGITVLGVYVAALVVENVMIHAALEDEAEHFWRLRQQQPNHPTPNTNNLRGYVADGKTVSHLPPPLVDLPLGFHRQPLGQSEPIVYVDQRDDQRLYLVFDEQSVARLSFYFGVVPLSLALGVIYVSAWFAYRSSAHSVSPIVSLAQLMRQFNWGEDDPSELDFQRYTDLRSGDEVSVLAAALQGFTQRLQQQLEREQSFTRDVSHELRTPLAVIQGSVAILAKSPGLDARQQRAVDRMAVTSRDMASLIETLLLLAREQQSSGSAESLMVPVSVNGLIVKLIEQINATSNADGHVYFTLQTDQALELEAPAQVISSVLGNILRNACHYSFAGEVRVQIQGTQVAITDSGCGMSEAEQQRLQAPFERGNSSVAGYGLGLDIVRRLCERYQWRFQIQSQPASGTCVSVDFHSSAPEPVLSSV